MPSLTKTFREYGAQPMYMVASIEEDGIIRFVKIDGNHTLYATQTTKHYVKTAHSYFIYHYEKVLLTYHNRGSAFRYIKRNQHKFKFKLVVLEVSGSIFHTIEYMVHDPEVYEIAQKLKML